MRQINFWRKEERKKDRKKNNNNNKKKRNKNVRKIEKHKNDHSRLLAKQKLMKLDKNNIHS
jgi:hypothetical protein